MTGSFFKGKMNDCYKINYQCYLHELPVISILIFNSWKLQPSAKMEHMFAVETTLNIPSKKSRYGWFGIVTSIHKPKKS